MKTIKLSALAILAAVAAAPVHAAVIDAAFTGTVTAQAATANTVGSTITGEFRYDTAANAYTLFTVAGVSTAAGYASLANVTPDRLTALYTALISAVSTGGATNSAFTLDLEGVDPFPAGTAIGILTNSAQIPGNLDFASSPSSLSPSTFGYNLSNADGTNVRRVSASLTAITIADVTPVPEPASLAVFAMFLLGLAAVRRRA